MRKRILQNCEKTKDKQMDDNSFNRIKKAIPASVYRVDTYEKEFG